MAKLVTFSGIDGCGKSTLIKALSEELVKDYDVLLMSITRPYHSPWTDKLREVLFSFIPEATQYLFGAMAVEAGKIINRAVQEQSQPPTIILCDRYTADAIAYSTVNGGREVVETYLNDIPKPDLQYWLKISPEKAIARTKNSKEHKDEYDQDLEMLTKVHKEFEKNEDLIVLPAGNSDVNTLIAMVKDHIDQEFEKS